MHMYAIRSNIYIYAHTQKQTHAHKQAHAHTHSYFYRPIIMQICGSQFYRKRFALNASLHDAIIFTQFNTQNIYM